MRVTLLGSGTLVPDRRRHSAAHHVAGKGFAVLFDCGAGTLHGMERYGVAWTELTHLVLSHFHTDHVGDVAALLFALKHGAGPYRTVPLTLLGPPGTAGFVERLVDAHLGYFRELGFELRVEEVPREGGWADPDGRFHLGTFPTPHTEHSIACRLEAGEGVVGYTGDTGPSRPVGRFLRGCHLLVAECSLPDPLEVDTHLSPATLAELASEARPELLIATHLYPSLEPGELPELVRAGGYGGEVRVGWDGMVVEVEAGAVRVTDPGGGSPGEPDR